ncbi:Uncharacterized protein QTN25_003943 [Entamoeba marina]
MSGRRDGRHKHDKTKDEASKIQKIKQDINKVENEMKNRENEFNRLMADYEVELKFLEAKVQYQTTTDQEELKTLNAKIREYKVQIKKLNEQIGILSISLASSDFQARKDVEKNLREEIEKLKKSKSDKEKKKNELKSLLKVCDKKYEDAEREKIKCGTNVAQDKQKLAALDNLKQALEKKLQTVN